MHTREAAPKASVLKLSVTYPLPMKKIVEFAKSVERCGCHRGRRSVSRGCHPRGGHAVEGKAEMYRFGELDVSRVRRILDHV